MITTTFSTFGQKEEKQNASGSLSTAEALSPPTYPLLSLALHLPLKNSTEPLHRRKHQI